MLNILPEHLEERVRFVNDEEKILDDGPVIVWLKSSHRFHENPAIDVGRVIAEHHNLPMLVYHGIDERYPHASLRHHNSLLDAAVDVSRLCKKNGIKHVLHVAREGHRSSVMREFAGTASLIITDLFPIPPWDDWVRNVAKIAKCPVIEVDCHCVIPMPLYGKSVDRPFKFRSATKKLRKARIQRPWPRLDAKPEPYEGNLPFTPVDIESEVADMNARFNLLKQCDIDPTVHPVWSEKGGENFAISKWQQYLDKGLSGYARRRNNAADPNGVSRLSSAFHYGFLSPMKVAREAAAVGTKAAEKYLDELLIFREHAWHHIYSSDDPYSPANLPGWALGSWRRAEGDVRTTIVPEHRLEYSDSPSDLWNACQTSLVRHGELHNNLRMTWGKAFPPWTKSLEKSLELSQKLNDKYALDGRDPSSIVGVQWCHGLFDRPFEPSEPVMGVVRKRDIETHKSRLDFATYSRHVNRINGSEKRKYIVNLGPINQALVSRIIDDNGYEVYMTKSSENSINFQISKLDLKNIPVWLRERFDSILSNSDPGDFESLTDELSRNISKISLSIGNSFEFSDVKSMLAIDTTNPEIGVVTCNEYGQLVISEFGEGHELQNDQEVGNSTRTSENLESLVAIAWEVAGIIWSDNCDYNPSKFSIQSTLM